MENKISQKAYKEVSLALQKHDELFQKLPIDLKKHIKSQHDNNKIIFALCPQAPQKKHTQQYTQFKASKKNSICSKIRLV